MGQLKHFDDSGMARFITFCCFQRQKYLYLPDTKELLIKHLQMAREKYTFKLLGYVIMPEHVHLVILPPDSMKLGLVIREIKSRMAKDYFANIRPDIPAPHVFWQKRCYDHNCRTPESIREKIVYCHNNPVKRGLVTDPGNYRWSSHNWYLGWRDVPLTIDGMEQ
jgi:putative transposase